MNKPEILTDGQVVEWLTTNRGEETLKSYRYGGNPVNSLIVEHYGREAQRDADAAYYEPLLKREYLRGQGDASEEWADRYFTDMTQARREAKEKIFTDLWRPCQHGSSQCLQCIKELETKYLGPALQGMRLTQEQQDDLIRQKFRRDIVFEVEVFLEEQGIDLYYTGTRGDERVIGERADHSIIRQILEEES